MSAVPVVPAAATADLNFVSAGQRPIGTFIILTSLAVITAGVLSAEPLQSANDRSRWSTVWSLVERGTWHIDEIDRYSRWATIDKVRHRDSEDAEWHFYSSKPPLLSAVVAGLYWIERHTLGYGLFHHTLLVSRLLLLLVNVLPLAVGLFCFRNSLQKLNIPPTTFRFVLLAAGLGSMLNPFMTTLNNHTPAAVSLLICLSAMIRVRLAEPESRSGFDFAVIGFTAALTCCFELPAALFGLLSFGFVLTLSRSRTLLWYVPAALIPLAAFFITNWLVTGGVKPFYAYYGTEKYVYVHEGVPSYWSDPQDLDANQESPPVYLFHCLLGHHGILSLTPVFWLTLAGWGMGSFRSHWRQLRFVLMCGSGLSVLILAFYLSRTENYNYGGNSSSLRWMLWLVPFWWYGMLPAVVWLTEGPRFRVARRVAVLAALLAMSVFTACWSLTEPWKPSWLYTAMQQAGWIDYQTPDDPFTPPRYSVLAAIPETAGTQAQWSAAEGTGLRRLQLRSAGLISVNGQPAIGFSLQIVEFSSDQQSVSATRQLAALAGPFRQGQDISVWLRQLSTDTIRTGGSYADSVVQPAEDWVLTLLRGMPAARAYNPGGKRYHRLRESDPVALACERAASRVVFQHPLFGRCWQRCDVLYCADLPFGVMKWTTKVTQEATGELVSVSTWIPAVD